MHAIDALIYAQHPIGAFRNSSTQRTPGKKETILIYFFSSNTFDIGLGLQV